MPDSKAGHYRAKLTNGFGWRLPRCLSVGVLAFVFARHINRLRCDVESVIGVANNLIKLVLAPPGRRRLAYEAGQFVYMAPFDPSLSAGYGKKHPDTLFS